MVLKGMYKKGHEIQGRWGHAGSSWRAGLRHVEVSCRRVLSREVIVMEARAEETTLAVG